MSEFISDIKVKNGIEFRHSFYFDCFINLYTIDENNKLSCNGSRIRTKNQLKDLHRFAQIKIDNYQWEFDDLLGSFRDRVTKDNHFQLSKIIAKIIFWKHIKDRCTIYVNRNETIRYVNSLNRLK